jgi:glycosyltransferase involved in cell wall biosynthesis
VIPCLNPDEKFYELLKQAGKLGFFKILVVDDGSVPAISRDRIPSSLSAVEVVRHNKNLGKGAAIKSAIKYIMKNYPDAQGIVTADCDGQHQLHDIERVLKYSNKFSEQFILSTRIKTDAKVPLRSRFGNSFTKFVFNSIYRTNLADTQSGLRAIPKSYFAELLGISLNGYDFEMEMIRILNEKSKIKTIDIERVYIDDNNSSHFRPVFDSLKIYYVFFRSVLSSFLVLLADYTLYITLLFLGTSNSMSLIFSRLTGLLILILMSKVFVWKSNRRFLSFTAYYIIAWIINTVIVVVIMEQIVLPNFKLVISRLVLELILYFLTFIGQRYIFFQNPKAPNNKV